MKRTAFRIIVSISAFVFLYTTSRYDYVLFHTLVELFSVAIGFSLFMIVWNARGWMHNRHFFVLGVGLAAASGLDLVHTLAYSGLNLFPGYDANLPTQLWIAARSIQALSMLVAPFYSPAGAGTGESGPHAERGDTLPSTEAFFHATVSIFAATALILLYLTLSGLFPDCYIEGQGLTAFKRMAEYGISAVLLASLVHIRMKRSAIERTLLRLLAAATVATIFSELTFTLYVDVFDFSNFVGHMFRLISSVLLYIAGIQTGLRRPYGLLFGDLEKKASELKESEEKYRILIEGQDDLVAHIDGGMRIRYINPAFRAMLGTTSGDPVGRSLADLLDEQNREFLKAGISLVMEPPHETQYEARMAGSAGWSWYSWSMKALPEAGERGNSILLVGRDTTARKHSENLMAARDRILRLRYSSPLAEVLRATVDEAESLTESSIGFHHVADRDQKSLSFRVWSTNTLRFEARDGLSPTEYGEGETGIWEDCLHERRPVIHNDGPILPHREERPGGRSRIVRELAVPIFRKDSIVAVIGVGNKATAYDANDIAAVSSLADLAWDIANLKRAEEALLESRERYKLAQEAADAGSWEWNLASGENLWSERLWELYGIDPECGKASFGLWLESIHPGDRERASLSVREAAAKGTELNIEWRVNLPNNGMRWLMSRGKPYSDEDGRVTRFIGIVIDITSRKGEEERIFRLNEQLEMRVRERTMQLDAAYRDLESFSYSVSHDLRAPLRAIEGFGEALREYRGQLDDRGWHYLERILASTRRMEHMIGDLLDLSRMTSVRLTRSKVDLGAIAREILEELQSADPARRVTLEVAPDLIAEGDPDLVKILLENLLGNAWKFTGRCDSPSISLGSLLRDGVKIFSVSDNGAGFDPSVASRLFLPFQRLHSGKEFPGTGIGLSIASRIVTRHGGRIWAESEVNRGTTFHFTLEGCEEIPVREES